MVMNQRLENVSFRRKHFISSDENSDWDSCYLKAAIHGGQKKPWVITHNYPLISRVRLALLSDFTVAGSGIFYHIKNLTRALRLGLCY